MSKYSHLWNDLPLAERSRLMPYEIESQIRHIEQVRAIIVRHHKAELAEIDGWLKNCNEGLERQVKFNQIEGVES